MCVMTEEFEAPISWWSVIETTMGVEKTYSPSLNQDRNNMTDVQIKQYNYNECPEESFSYPCRKVRTAPKWFCRIENGVEVLENSSTANVFSRCSVCADPLDEFPAVID